MRLVPACALQIIHEFEGKNGAFEPVPVQDPAGNWEIGWSHRIADPAHWPLPITKAHADALALADLNDAGIAICGALSSGVVAELTDPQYAALACFTYNEGAEQFRTSTMCRLLRSGAEPETVAAEFDKWVFLHEDGVAVKSDGLVRRRAAEKAMFLS